MYIFNDSQFGNLFSYDYYGNGCMFTKITNYKTISNEHILYLIKSSASQLSMPFNFDKNLTLKSFLLESFLAVIFPPQQLCCLLLHVGSLIQIIRGTEHVATQYLVGLHSSMNQQQNISNVTHVELQTLHEQPL